MIIIYDNTISLTYLLTLSFVVLEIFGTEKIQSKYVFRDSTPEADNLLSLFSPVDSDLIPSIPVDATKYYTPHFKQNTSPASTPLINDVPRVVVGTKRSPAPPPPPGYQPQDPSYQPIYTPIYKTRENNREQNTRTYLAETDNSLPSSSRLSPTWQAPTNDGLYTNSINTRVQNAGKNIIDRSSKGKETVVSYNPTKPEGASHVHSWRQYEYADLNNSPKTVAITNPFPQNVPIHSFISNPPYNPLENIAPVSDPVSLPYRQPNQPAYDRQLSSSTPVPVINHHNYIPSYTTQNAVQPAHAPSSFPNYRDDKVNFPGSDTESPGYRQYSEEIIIDEGIQDYVNQQLNYVEAGRAPQTVHNDRKLPAYNTHQPTNRFTALEEDRYQYSAPRSLPHVYRLIPLPRQPSSPEPPGYDPKSPSPPPFRTREVEEGFLYKSPATDISSESEPKFVYKSSSTPTSPNDPESKQAPLGPSVTSRTYPLLQKEEQKNTYNNYNSISHSAPGNDGAANQTKDTKEGPVQIHKTISITDLRNILQSRNFGRRDVQVNHGSPPGSHSPSPPPPEAPEVARGYPVFQRNPPAPAPDFTWYSEPEGSKKTSLQDYNKSNGQALQGIQHSSPQQPSPDRKPAISPEYNLEPRISGGIDHQRENSVSLPVPYSTVDSSDGIYRPTLVDQAHELRLAPAFEAKSPSPPPPQSPEIEWGHPFLRNDPPAPSRALPIYLKKHKNLFKDLVYIPFDSFQYNPSRSAGVAGQQISFRAEDNKELLVLPFAPAPPPPLNSREETIADQLAQESARRNPGDVPDIHFFPVAQAFPATTPNPPYPQGEGWRRSGEVTESPGYEPQPPSPRRVYQRIRQQQENQAPSPGYAPYAPAPPNQPLSTQNPPRAYRLTLLESNTVSPTNIDYSDTQRNESDNLIDYDYDQVTRPPNMKLFSLQPATSDNFGVGDTDENNLCCFWAETNECGKNPEFMLRHCKKSCSASGCAGCTDEMNLCGRWAAHGECDHNMQYMKYVCRSACTNCLPLKKKSKLK